jgi:hypothetical protein
MSFGRYPRNPKQMGIKAIRHTDAPDRREEVLGDRESSLD